MEQTSMGRGDAIRKLRQAHVDWQSLAPHHARSLSGRATALPVIQKQKTRPGLVPDKEPEFGWLALPARASPRECCEGMKIEEVKGENRRNLNMPKPKLKTRVRLTDGQLCKMIREAVKDRPDLGAPAGMKFARTEMLDGKPVHCYVET